MAYKPSQTVAWRVLPDGSIDSISTPERNGGSRDTSLGYQASPPSVADFNSRIGNYPYQSLADAQRAQQDMKTQQSIDALRADYDKKLADISSKENTNNALAQQIAALSGGNQPGATIGAVSQALPANLSAPAQLPANLSAPAQLPAGLSSSALDAISGGISQLALAQNPAITALFAGNNFATSPLANKLNFQVSDQQILDDYNNTKLGRLNSIVQQGNTQVAGIQQRLNAAQTLLDQLPKNDPRYTSSKVYVDQLNSDLKSVTDAITGANTQIKDFKPIAIGTPEAGSQITSFREYLQLPEERATQQLRQIDPESYKTAVDLGRRYREMANAPIGQTQNAQTEAFRAELEKGYRDYSASGIGATQDAQTEAYRAQLQKEIQGYSLGEIGATTSPQSEALRRQVEDETAAQLALGSRLGAEEQRQYQQYSRAAQTARGNIFGVAPAVEEAVTTGMAGEARKQARYGAASQFLSSGQTTSDALARDIQLREALQQGRYQAGGAMLASGQTVSDAMARDVQLRNALQQSKLGAGAQFMASGQTASDALKADLAFRDALLQSRLGAASGFIAGGPSLYNLGQARTGAQQSAFQNYIQANQALPGQFGQAPSTAQPFYQATNPETPTALTNAFNNLYSSIAGYQAKTYGDYVGAQAATYTSPSKAFGNIAGGLAGLVPSFSFSR